MGHSLGNSSKKTNNILTFLILIHVLTNEKKKIHQEDIFQTYISFACFHFYCDDTFQWLQDPNYGQRINWTHQSNCYGIFIPVPFPSKYENRGGGSGVVLCCVCIFLLTLLSSIVQLRDWTAQVTYVQESRKMRAANRELLQELCWEEGQKVLKIHSPCKGYWNLVSSSVVPWQFTCWLFINFPVKQES